MKYRFISDNSESFSVVEMAAIFKIHRGSYYKWLKSSKRRTERKTKEVELVNEIKAIQDKSRYSYGTPRVTKELIKMEFICQQKFERLEDLKRELFDYVNWYNNKRIHGSLGYLTPVEFKKMMSEKKVS